MATSSALPPAEVSDITLLPAGRGRFSDTPAVFTAPGGCRIVYQVSRAEKTPIVILGGGMSGRVEACQAYAAESPAFAAHTVLIFDRRNTGASDVDFVTGCGEGAQYCEVDAQVSDLCALLAHLSLPPCILIGHSSGARLFGRFALEHPQRVHALVMCVLTGGKRAAKNLGQQYYLKFAKLARKGGMEAVLQAAYYAERSALNRRVADTLRAMDAETFAAACASSARLFTDTSGEPALGLPAEKLRALAMPVLVANYVGEPHDGMHTPEVSRAVAAAIPTAGEAVVLPDPLRLAVEHLLPFVRRHSGAEDVPESSERAS